MASLSDILSTVQNGVIALNNLTKQMSGSLNNILGRLNNIGPLYASQFGVVGDGITNNTISFNAAMAAFPSSGGTLIMPPGICIGVFNVTKPVIIQGQGMGKVGATTGTGQTELRSNGAADNILMFSANSGGVRDLLITSSVAVGSRTGAGLKIGSIQGIEVRNVVSNGHKYGFWNTAPGNTFIQCYGNVNQTAGLYLDGSVFDQSEIEVLDCQFNSNINDGVLIGGNGIGIFTKRMTSANNGNSGVTILGGSTISDLYFDQPEISGNALHGIDANSNTGINLGISGDGVVEVLTGTGNAVTTGTGQGGVNISGTNITGGASAVAINFLGADTVITGSQILGQATPNGFTINFGAAASNFIIDGCLIKKGNATFGILVNAGATIGRVNGNTFTGFAAGNAIIDNSAVASVVFSNNGGTNINQTIQSAATGNITTNGAFGTLFTGTVAVTFTKPFLSAPIVVVSPHDANGAGGISAYAESITTTGFTARGLGVTNGGVFACYYTASLTTN